MPSCGRSVDRSIGGDIVIVRTSVGRSVGRSFDRYAMVLIMQCDTPAAIPAYACDVRHTVDWDL